MGVKVYDIEKHDPCPALKFEGEVATCILATLLISPIPVGEGCCIKARAYKNGVEYDFASLPPELKRRAAQDRRKYDRIDCEG